MLRSAREAGNSTALHWQQVPSGLLPALGLLPSNVTAVMGARRITFVVFVELLKPYLFCVLLYADKQATAHHIYGSKHQAGCS